jgi:hypothetical protein
MSIICMLFNEDGSKNSLFSSVCILMLWIKYFKFSTSIEHLLYYVLLIHLHFLNVRFQK